jgi:AmmeMemoRadiSam system protein A
MSCSSDEKSLLLAVALDSIKSGLDHGKPVRLNIGDYSTRLNTQRASFVTLNHGKSLRGCIGTLEARTSLVESVAENAWAAAFRDPRFAALTAPEVSDLSIQVSVLGPLTPVTVASEQELLTKMIPGEAGWVLQERGNRGTFLPAVWSSLGDPAEFLRQLKIKAGLSPGYWSDTLEFWSYTADSFSAAVTDIANPGQDAPKAV